MPLQTPKNKMRQVMLRVAYTCVGKTFKYGALPSEAPHAFDCSGLVQYLYYQAGVDLPRSTILQAHHGKIVRLDKNRNTLKTGDLLFFHGQIGHYNLEFPQGIGHVAMYMEDGECIQATGKSGKVLLISLANVLQRDDLVVVKRIL